MIKSIALKVAEILLLAGVTLAAIGALGWLTPIVVGWLSRTNPEPWHLLVAGGVLIVVAIMMAAALLPSRQEGEG